MYLNGCLYYSGLCITHSALSTVINITVILLNGMYLNGRLYYSGLCITHSALSTVITVNGYIKL